MVGATAIHAFIKRPGVTSQRGDLGEVTFGETSNGITPRGEQLHRVFADGGWAVELTAKALRAVWEKFIFLTGSA